MPSPTKGSRIHPNFSIIDILISAPSLLKLQQPPLKPLAGSRPTHDGNKLSTSFSYKELLFSALCYTPPEQQLLAIQWILLEIEALTGPESMNLPDPVAYYALGHGSSTSQAWQSCGGLLATEWSQTRMPWCWRRPNLSQTPGLPRELLGINGANSHILDSIFWALKTNDLKGKDRECEGIKSNKNGKCVVNQNEY